MKIVQVEDFFHPSAGYQANVLSKYFVKNGNEVTVICGIIDEKTPAELTGFWGIDGIQEKDAEYSERNHVKIIRLPVYRYISHRAVFGLELYKAINSEKPDILFAHGNDTLTSINLILRYSNSNQFKLISDSHMLEMASRNRFSKLFRIAYKHLIAPLITKHNITIIRTQNDDYVEKCLGIPLSRCPYIPIGADVLLFHRDNQMKSAFRERLNISDDAFVFIYAGKLDEAKGVNLLADAIQRKFQSDREIVFLIVGNAVGEFGERIEQAFSKSENRIIRFPTQMYPDLAQFYQSSNAAIFPKQCSLSFYDVQACGLPVISEDNNINIERNNHGNGFCFKADCIEDLRRKIQVMIDKSKLEYDEMSSNAEKYVLQYFNCSNTAKKYLAEMEKSLHTIQGGGNNN